MKPLIVVLCLSLAANLTLAVVYWKASPAGPPATAPAKTSVRPGPPAAAAEDDVAAALRAHPDFAEAAKSGDPRRMREALIRAGFPDTYVRDMVTFHTGNSVTPERLELLRHQAEKPFWQTSLGEEGLALQKALREEEARNNALTKEVFGGKIPPHPLDALNQQRRYRFLPADKAEAVARIDSDYGEMESENRRTAMTSEGRDKARLLQQEKRADLAKVLSPAELELYDLTISPTAENMRRQLALFQPTQEEFRALFEIRRVVDEKYGGTYGPMDRTQMQQWNADMQVANGQARTLLGEQRYLEYQRAQDYGYRAAVEIVKHFQLPDANAAETYMVQHAAMKQAQEINRSAGADRAATAAQIAKLVNDTERQLTRLLGAAGADAYKKSGGSWLIGLQRTATAPGGPTAARRAEPGRTP